MTLKEFMNHYNLNNKGFMEVATDYHNKTKRIAIVIGCPTLVFLSWVASEFGV